MTLLSQIPTLILFNATLTSWHKDFQSRILAPCPTFSVLRFLPLHLVCCLLKGATSMIFLPEQKCLVQNLLLHHLLQMEISHFIQVQLWLTARNIEPLLAIYSIFVSLTQTYHMLWISYPNSCIAQRLNIGLLQIDCFDIFVAHWLMDYFFIRQIHFLFMPSHMKIGLETNMTIPLRVLILFILVVIQFIGHPRNNVQLLNHPQRLSIDQLSLLL